MTSTDRKKVTQFVVALPGPDNETERATPCPVPRRPPRAVKAATRRSRGGLRPAWTGVLRGSLRTSPFSFRKMGIFQSQLKAKYLVHDPALCPWKLTNRVRSLAVVRMMMMLTEGVVERSFPGDRLRVAVVELSVRVDVHAAMRAVVFVGLDLAIGALPGEVLTLLW